MSQLHEEKCPNCGAPLRFDPSSEKLVCDYCDSSFTIEEIQNAAADSTAAHDSQAAAQSDSGPQQSEQKEKVLQGFDYKSLTDSITQIDAESLPVYACVSCGADLIAEPAQSSLTCPYCGNNIVLTDKVSGFLRPDGVVPFRITSEQLPDAVAKYYKGKKLLPKGFFSSSKIGRVTGVYAPFWVFNGKLAGSLTFDASKVHTHRSGDYLITETEHYLLSRDASVAFEDLPVDAGEKIDNKLMDSLEPFHTDQAKPFDMRYLAGFTAERFDEKKSTVSARAQKRMSNSAISAITSAAGSGYSGVSYHGGSLRTDLNAKYLLFPVYLFEIEHDGKAYPFAVNGQTGKVVGELPVSKATGTAYFLKRFGIISGVLILYSVLKYLLGW